MPVLVDPADEPVGVIRMAVASGPPTTDVLAASEVDGAVGQLGVSMFDACGDGVLVVTCDDHKVRYANPAARDMFGDTILGAELGTPNDGSEVDLVGSDGRVAELRVTQVALEGSDAWLVLLRDVTERKATLQEARADRDLAREQAERRTILLREVDHRVVNTFQMLASLVHMRHRATDDARLAAELAQIRERITAIGRSLHALNRAGSHENVALSEFLREILGDLVGLDASAKLRLALGPGEIVATRAQYVGLIVHELTRNAIKYAYPGDRHGEVVVTSHAGADGDLVIVVTDDGVGFTPDTVSQGTGLGSDLNRALATMLGGSLSITSSETGTRCELVIPLRQSK